MSCYWKIGPTALALLALAGAGCTAAHNTAQGASSAASGAVATVTNATTDSSIDVAIKGKLVEDRLIRSRDIATHTQNGYVTLEGIQSSWAARERAEQIAWSVRGVRGVHNEIVVVPPT